MPTRTKAQLEKEIELLRLSQSALMADRDRLKKLAKSRLAKMRQYKAQMIDSFRYGW